MARLIEAPHRRHPWSAPALAYVARALSSNRVCHVSDRSFLGGNQNPAFGLGIFIAPARLLARQYYASAPFLGPQAGADQERRMLRGGRGCGHRLVPWPPSVALRLMMPAPRLACCWGR